MRSLCNAWALLTTTLGNYLSSMIVTVVACLSGKDDGWIPSDNLDKGHLDYDKEENTIEGRERGKESSVFLLEFRDSTLSIWGFSRLPHCSTFTDSSTSKKKTICDSTMETNALEDERRIVTELISEAGDHLKEGNSYFVISHRWYTSWERCVTRPGPIDNHDLIDSQSDASDPQLRRNLEESVDYVLVPEQVWNKLLEWYTGGPAIQRKLICQGFQRDSYTVEVYPLCLKLTDGRDGSSSTIRLSKQASVSQLYEVVCSARGVSKEKARIWDYFEKKKSVLLDRSSERTLEDSCLQTDHDILLEVDEHDMSSAGNELAIVPVGPTRSDAMKTINDDAGGSSSGFEKRGLRGLDNLGNTCFMNSSLQCLAHTPPFVDYFLKNYRDDINEDNPYGTRGELTTEFGELLSKLWSSEPNAFAPHFFKTKLAKFAPQFSGYNQHDCHEMLTFLLDKLHEDLNKNKVKEKPYVECKDSDGRPDDEVAEEVWNNHKARNDSVIVDVCQGQYKSTLTCPDCGKFSRTFDPFMYLSLPLETSLTRSMTVSVFYGDGNRSPTPYTVLVPKKGSLGDLSNALGAACGLKDDESLLFADVYAHKVYKYLEISMLPLSEIRDNDRIVAYRFNQIHRGPGKSKLEILHWDQKLSDFGRDAKIFGVPLVTYVNTERHSGSDTDAIISGLLSPLRRAHSSSGSLEDTNTTTVGEEELSFSVFGLDRFSYSLKPLESDVVPNPLSATRLVVKWDEKEHEKYDSSSYLNDLPEVYKATSLAAEEVSLFSCLEAFLAEEPLGADERSFCRACQENKRSNKRLSFWKLPEILVVQLKRFTYTELLRSKIDTFVDFPIHDLDLSKYVTNKEGGSYLYELYAISNHYGGLTGGHYTAYAKLMDENKWYVFDDSRVTAIDESKIKTKAAYVLYYRRVRSESEASSMDED
ncbi:Peptidase C19 [Hirschfeldia incana]|nr:Peptidase C19 [Hirschfeldia incana]